MPDHNNVPVTKLTVDDLEFLSENESPPQLYAGPPRIASVEQTKTDQLKHNFTYHAPSPAQQEKYVALRAKALELALLIHDLTPSSREQSLAFTHVEEAIFWANASIARSS